MEQLKLWCKIPEKQSKRQHFHRNNFEFHLIKRIIQINLIWSMLKILFLRISWDLKIASFDLNQSRSINFMCSLSWRGKTATRRLALRRRFTKFMEKKIDCQVKLFNENLFQIDFQRTDCVFRCNRLIHVTW